MIRRITLLAVMALILSTFPIMAVGASGDHPGLTPDSVDVVLFPGQSVEIEKTVHTPEIPPNPAIVFLADTTGSMGGVLANVAANGTPIMNAVLAVQPTAVFGAAEYRDIFDAFTFKVNQGLTASVGTVQTAMDGWSAGGGGDTPEAQLYALTQLATGAVTFPVGSTPIIVWFGDASGHDPRNGATEAGATAALQAAGITVIAIDAGGGGDGLDNTGQATRIANATGGVFLSSPNAADTAAAILAGLSNLPAEVTMMSDCEDPISTTFAPATVTVVSGGDAVFTETIAVSGGEGDYTCRDWALIDGEPMRDAAGAIIYETKTIHVPVHFLTGGGQTDKGKKALNFGGNVGWLADGSIVGQWHFRDGGAKLMMHSLSIDSLVFSNDAGADPDPPAADYEVATFSGTARVKDGTAKWIDTCTFTAQAHDHGEPNVADVFGIRIDCGADGDWTYGRLVLDTGNFQIHSGLKG